MRTGITYPEWVQEYRKKGTTVKKVGNNYYLYKRTSKRVPGKKYPQPVDTYIGMITPDGITPFMQPVGIETLSKGTKYMLVVESIYGLQKAEQSVEMKGHWECEFTVGE